MSTLPSGWRKLERLSKWTPPSSLTCFAVGDDVLVTLRRGATASSEKYEEPAKILEIWRAKRNQDDPRILIAWYYSEATLRARASEAAIYWPQKAKLVLSSHTQAVRGTNLSRPLSDEKPPDDVFLSIDSAGAEFDYRHFTLDFPLDRTPTEEQLPLLHFD
ncbi:Hypothetical protein D9617_51g089080 [Elsinoe fawcettii]|nr:Hypothetical protein D9617_51g089080 [Elsinoe fawcettii]